MPSVLQEVSLPIITNNECEGMYRKAGYIEHIPNIFICAGYSSGGKDSCEVIHFHTTLTGIECPRFLHLKKKKKEFLVLLCEFHYNFFTRAIPVVRWLFSVKTTVLCCQASSAGESDARKKINPASTRGYLNSATG